MEGKNILHKLRKWVMKISPPLPVGGLEVTDSAVRYAFIKGDNIIQASIRLEPGMVNAGRIKNKEAFIKALEELHRRISPSKKHIVSIVLSLPIRDVYIQTFSVPRIADVNFSQAAELNAKMVSPIDIDNSYYGWQRTEGGAVSNNINVLGAFVSRDVADEFISIFEESGFSVAAVEFASISISRDLERMGVVKEGSPYIAVEITTEGMQFITIRNNLPHFHSLHSWNEVQGDGKAISVENFKIALEEELNKILNFFSSRWAGEVMKDIVFITPALANEISTLINKKFSDLKVRILEPADVSVAVGAARRGSVPRGEDIEISLAGLSALGVFERQEAINFVRIWRNVFLTALGFLLAIFVASNIFIRGESIKVTSKVSEIHGDPRIVEFNTLITQVGNFNELVGMIGAFRSSENVLTPFFRRIDELSGEDISITRLNFQSLDIPIRLNGNALNQGAAVSFKNRIAEQSQFSNVDLPLSSVSDSGRAVLFTLTFKVDSLDFDK